MNPVYIVAGGPSLRNFDFQKLKDKTTIVINKSIFDVPDPTYFLTIDYSFLQYLSKQNLLNKWKEMSTYKVFIANFSHDYLKIIDDQVVDTRFNLKYNLADFNLIIPSYCQSGIGFTMSDFTSGNNSGFCGLQFAIAMGYNPIYLLGFDLYTDTETHYHLGYNRSRSQFQKNLQSYFGYFGQALASLKVYRPNLKIYSCSEKSLLNEFIEYKDFNNIKESL